MCKGVCVQGAWGCKGCVRSVQGGVQWGMQGMWRVCKEHLGCAKLVESMQGVCKAHLGSAKQVESVQWGVQGTFGACKVASVQGGVRWGAQWVGHSRGA